MSQTKNLNVRRQYCETLRQAELFLRSLPDDIPSPELCFDPDCDISFDWMVSRHHTYSISINARGRLSVAWIAGEKSGCATHDFNDSIVPSEIIEGIREIRATDLIINNH